MSVTGTTVDFSTLPAPAIVEQIAFEDIVSAMLAHLQSRMLAAGVSFTALTETDTAYKIIEVCAYREVMMRQRANEACVGVMLAYAEGPDLDNIGANYNCPRLTITPANNTTTPPTTAVMEQDTPYRLRIQQSIEGYSVAGPVGAYQYFARSASGDVLDVSVTSPQGGTVLVSILSHTGNGTAPSATLAAVTAALTATNVRPLCDTVVVQSSTVIEYSINAVLTIAPTADAATVLALAQSNAQLYATAVQKNGYTAAVALIEGALGVAGVTNVALQAPGITADIVTTPQQATYCTGINITIGGVGV
jgi:phage-related baseplate assembly protein